MKSQGFSQTPQDIMEEYNGCSVPQYTRYRSNRHLMRGYMEARDFLYRDGSKWDARDKKNLLPTSVAPEAVGTKIRIRNPDIFVDWLQSASISTR